MFANAFRGKNGSVFKPEDFFPLLRPKPRRQTPDDHVAAALAWAELLGGQITTTPD